MFSQGLWRRVDAQHICVMSEEHRRQRVLTFLGQFGLHASDGGLEEVDGQEFVRAFCPNLFEGRDIFLSVFHPLLLAHFVGNLLLIF